MTVINVALKAKTTPGLGFNTQLSAAGDISDTTMLLDTLLHGSPKSASVTAPPASPAFGDSYIIPTGATGAWANQVGSIAVCNPTTIKDGRIDNYHWQWDIIQPKTGMSFYVQDATCTYEFNGTAWVPGPLVYVGTAPASATATGIKGQIIVDATGLLYVCFQTNTWRKFTGATF